MSGFLRATQGQQSRTAVISQDGTWRLTNLGSGEWELETSLSGPGFYREIRDTVRLSPEEPEARRDLDLFMGEGTLTGHLTRGEEPVFVNLKLMRPTGEVVGAAAYGKEDQDVPFRFDSLRPGTYQLRIEDQDYGRVLTREVEVSGNEEIAIDLRK